jgi:hypothetical protein
VVSAAYLDEIVQNTDQIATHGATDAAVVHLEDLLLGSELVLQQRIVDSDLCARNVCEQDIGAHTRGFCADFFLTSELILDDGDPLSVIGTKDIVEKCRLA